MVRRSSRSRPEQAPGREDAVAVDNDKDSIIQRERQHQRETTCGKRFLLHDRDPLFSEAFRETLAATGVEMVRLAPHSPNLNAYAERVVRTIKESCRNVRSPLRDRG